MRFALESGEPRGGGPDFRAEHLDRHSASEPRVQCAVDDTHAAFADFLENPIMADRLADHVCVVVMIRRAAWLSYCSAGPSSNIFGAPRTDVAARVNQAGSDPANTIESYKPTNYRCLSTRATPTREVPSVTTPQMWLGLMRRYARTATACSSRVPLGDAPASAWTSKARLQAKRRRYAHRQRNRSPRPDQQRSRGDLHRRRNRILGLRRHCF